MEHEHKHDTVMSKVSSRSTRDCRQEMYIRVGTKGVSGTNGSSKSRRRTYRIGYSVKSLAEVIPLLLLVFVLLVDLKAVC